MAECKEEIERFDKSREQRAEQKVTSNRMRKNTSFMSFEMLDEDTFQFPNVS